MQARPLFEFIDFGTVFRYLKDTEEGTPFGGKDFVEENIERFFNSLREFNLLITLHAATALLLPLHEKLKEKGRGHRLTAREASRLRNVMWELHTTLASEASVMQAFMVTDKRITVVKLFFAVETLLAPDVFASLPPVAKYDLAECGKCIVFERPTAAAFHMLRGTEAVLRMFYTSIVKKNRIRNLMWGPVVEALRRRRNPPPPQLLDNLDNIRRSFRNPTQHPDATYNIEEAQDLFSLCVDVINRMITYLKSKGLIASASA